MSTAAPATCLRFRGAVYRLAIQVGTGQPLMSADEVAELLGEQYHNRGKVTVEKLKSRWVSSHWFILTEVYPALPEIGVSAGKTGETYSSGQPLVIDLDLQNIAVQNPDGSHPCYLVLDGQNRVVKLRREDPYQLYPAYVGIDILKDVERANRVLANRLQRRRMRWNDRRPSLDELL